MSVVFDKLLNKVLLHSHRTEYDAVYVNVTGDTMSGNLGISRNAVDDGVQFSAINTATSGNSGAGFYAQVDPSSTGDIYTQWSVDGITDWIFGIDNSDGDKFKIVPSYAIGAATAAITIKTDGKVGLNTENPLDVLDVLGNFRLKDGDSPTKSYRFRTDGSDLDFAGGGANFYISMYDDASFTTDQKFYLGFNTSDHYADAFGNWLFHNDIFGPIYFSVRDDNKTVAVNPDQSAIDFIVHGQHTTNIIKVIGSTDKLGFFNTTPASQQTGGATTASTTTYGSTEAGMLQKAYDALRTFGLLT